MKINNRSAFHDNKIKEIIDFVMPRLVDQIFKFYKKEFTLTISVKTANGYTGQYNNHKHGRYFIYLLVASSLRPFPFRELEVRDLHYKDPALQWKILWIRVQ